MASHNGETSSLSDPAWWKFRNLKRDALVFDDGDVVIEIGDGPHDIMVLHSSLLKQHSHWFACNLSGNWSAAEEEVIIDGRSRKIWRFDMYFDRETQLALLKTKVCYVLFQMSLLIFASSQRVSIRSVAYHPSPLQTIGTKVTTLSGHQI